MRCIPPDVVQRKAVCYSGYRANESQNGGPYPTEAEVTQDLNLLVQGGWTFLRLFDCGPAAAVTLQAIHDGKFDIKVLQGAGINGPAATQDAANQAELQRCLALNAMYSDIIVAWSIGNETLDSWSNIRTPAADMANYITNFRGQVTQPMTTDDFFTVFSLGPDGAGGTYASVASVIQVLDFLDVHTYPFIDAPYMSWDYQQLAAAEGPARVTATMAAAQAYNVANLMAVHAALSPMGIDRPIIIGETGWKTIGNQGTYEVSLASPVNQKMYYDTLEAWVYGSAKDANSPFGVFFFEFSDEPWKGGDDNWGLFDTNRYAKYAIWDTFPNLKPPGAPNYTSADAVYYKPGDPTMP
jgi:exo-beta-1,3-glucanase (GH17 family)